MNPSSSSNSFWKVHELRVAVEEEKLKGHFIPLIGLTETWLASHIKDAQIRIPGYIVSRSDRRGRGGGGVLLYSHENVPVSETSNYDDGICQALFCVFHTIKMCVCLVYRPPSTSKETYSRLLRWVNDTLSDVDESYQIILMGDFNFPSIDWSLGTVKRNVSVDQRESAEQFMEWLTRPFLNQYIFLPTRLNNVLDLFFTNNPFLVTDVEVFDCGMSDHRLVDIGVVLQTGESDDTYHTKSDFDDFDFNRADFVELNEKISAVEWLNLFEDCNFEDFPTLFTLVILQLCTEFVPVKKKKTGRPKQLNSLRRKKKRVMNRLAALRLRNGNYNHISCLESKIALITYEMKEVILNDQKRRENFIIEKLPDNPKCFYAHAKSHSVMKDKITMIKTDNRVITDSKAIADALQRQFSSVYSNPESLLKKLPVPASPELDSLIQEDFIVHDEDIISAISEISVGSAAGPDGVPAILLKQCAKSLAYPIRILWEESYRRGEVPSFYKESHVCPIFKKGDRSKTANYRPVSVTSHVVKVFERVMRKKIVTHLESRDIISSKQHGFRSGRSTLTQLLAHTNEVYNGLRSDLDVDTIYLDYAKAFDKVDHQILLLKMARYHINPKIIKWVNSFLVDRTQEVVVNGAHSYSAGIVSGVPQGTVLGPVLFVIFVNDLAERVQHSSISFFADDTRLSKQILTVDDCEKLQLDLEASIAWSNENNMELNSDKFQLLIHRANPSDIMELPFAKDFCIYRVSDSVQIDPIEKVVDLGVQVSQDGTWSAQIHQMAIKATSVAAWVLSVFRSRDRKVMLTLYKSLIRSHLEYCCPIWHPYKVEEVQRLENVQRNFTSRIIGMSRLSYWDRLKALGLMSLQRRRERYILLHTWKILNRVVPNDIEMEFRPESRNGIQAKVPTLLNVSRAANNSLFENSFAVVAPKLWNCIPASLSCIQSEETFKNGLTEFLKKLPDEPPAPGYVRRHRNTLMEVYRQSTN